MTTPRERRRVAVASLIGTTIEWYDFQLYGLASALVLPQLFFPSFDPAVGILLSFATFGVGFFARPVGAAIFGHLGDRSGRKKALVTTLLVMGSATFLIGLVPTYTSIGFWAPVLLVLLRLVQGVGLGGEWGGAVLMAVEHAPNGRRGLFGSLPQMGSPAGLLLATGVFSVVALLPDDAFAAWGWRIPFLLSAGLVLLGLVIRVAVSESPLFVQVADKGDRVRSPIVEVFRRHPRALLVSFGSFTVTSGGFYIYNTFMTSYTTGELGLDRRTVLIAGMLYAVGQLVSTPLTASLSDRIDRRYVFVGASLFTIAYAFPLFLLVGTRQPALLCVALVIAGAVNGSLYGVMGAIASESFPANVRYSGSSISYQLNGALAGGLTPFAATALVQAAGGAYWPAPLYLIGLATISLVAVTFFRPAAGAPRTPRRRRTGSPGLDRATPG